MKRGSLAALLIAAWLTGCATAKGPDTTTAFAAQSRGEARAFEAKGALADARLHWHYVAAVSPNDPEAAAEIRRLTGVIAERRDALVRQGEAAMKAGRAAQARTFYLKALALDGTDARARGALADMDVRGMLAFQEKKDQKDQKAMSDYVAQVHQDGERGTPPAATPAPAVPAAAISAAPVLSSDAPPTADPLRR